MGYSEFNGHSRPAWNVGRNVGPKRALRQKEVWAIHFWLDQKRRLRDRVPPIIEPILSGTPPTGINAASVRSADIPAKWDEQLAFFGM